MNSPILSYLSSYGIDPAYIMIGLLVLILILFILYIRTLCRMKKFYRAYDRFMRGKDMESMEDTRLNTRFSSPMLFNRSTISFRPAP